MWGPECCLKFKLFTYSEGREELLEDAKQSSDEITLLFKAYP